MIINTRLVPDGRTEYHDTTDLESMKADLPVLPQKINCSVAIDRSGTMLFVHVLFDGVCELECSRCLQVYNFRFNGEFRIILKEKVGFHGLAVDDEEATDYYFDTSHEMVDISPAFYDEIMTTIPLKPLCKLDCKGIVVKDKSVRVGFDDRKIDDEIDPRWEALKKLKK